MQRGDKELDLKISTKKKKMLTNRIVMMNTGCF